jgi:hypothetical protein
MALLKEATRNKLSASLLQYQTQGSNAVNVLKSLKAQLPNVKATVTADTDNFGAEDIADVQTVIDDLLADVASI